MVRIRGEESVFSEAFRLFMSYTMSVSRVLAWMGLITIFQRQPQMSLVPKAIGVPGKRLNVVLIHTPDMTAPDSLMMFWNITYHTETDFRGSLVPLPAHKDFL